MTKTIPKEKKCKKAMVRPPYLPLEKPVCSHKAPVRTDHGKTNGLLIGKGVPQSYIFSPCLFLTYMQSTSCKMPGWMHHKKESRLPGELSTPQICR